MLYDTRMLFGTKDGTPFIFPGTGTGGWEAALTNTLSPGDKVVTFRWACGLVVGMGGACVRGGEGRLRLKGCGEGLMRTEREQQLLA